MISRNVRSARFLSLCLLVALSTTGYVEAQAGLDTVRAGRFDAGKMWTFEYSPGAYFTETYGFDANPAWFERARLSALRIPGCSASFVSPNGLLATNHHCVRGAVVNVTRPGETLLDDGFYASTLEEERRIPDYYADQLIAIEDVTDEVFAALDRATTPEERERARSEAFERIEARARQAYADRVASLRVQIIALYNGGRYSAYIFRRFTDVRLVAAAELQMGFFGGDADNFTYPRYDLDFAFLRVYDQGQPYHTDHHFAWSTKGVQEGDLVFVIGNPGRTNRLSTIAQLTFQRDVELPSGLAFRTSRHAALRDYTMSDPANAERLGIRNRMFSLSNSLKANTGRYDALQRPEIMARKAHAERALRQAIEAKAALNQRYGMVLDRIAAIQWEKAKFSAPLSAFQFVGSSAFTSATERRAIAAFQYLEAKSAGAPADSVTALRNRLLGIGDLPRPLEHRFLAERLADFERYFGANHPITRAALRDGTAEASSAALLGGSVLADSAKTAKAVAENALTADDPAVRLAAVFVPAYPEFLGGYRPLVAEERELDVELGRARFEVYGQSVPPDGTSSPRITDGVVQGYEYNGTLAPPYTTFFGLYDRFYSHGPGTEWDLPARWKTPPVGLDLKTPLNFASTADTYGGNSGSPAVTPDLALVGLNFDRNMEGLSRDFIYLPERGRNVMVDVRAIQAALDHVYDADRIVRELVTGQLFRSEQEADAAAP
ncbi:MAG TPA: S46 family peptidase [Gemmatimonadales bacterium]|nr:S46 family peptidase [Gemmatimonadales bacterium]